MIANDKVIGGIGDSGVRSSEDAQIARAGRFADKAGLTVLSSRSRFAGWLNSGVGCAMQAIIADLEDQIAVAMADRLPQLKAVLVRPFVVTCQESSAGVVARSGKVALCISLASERFGVGFLSGDMAILENTDFYPSAELAAPAFSWAVANGS